MGIAWSVRKALPFLFASLGACASIEERGADSKPIKIYILADGSCKVQARTLACGEAPRYMHDSLKLSDVSQFIMVVRGKPSYETVMSFIEALGPAGFTGKLGIVNTAGMRD